MFTTKIFWLAEWAFGLYCIYRGVGNFLDEKWFICLLYAAFAIYSIWRAGQLQSKIDTFEKAKLERGEQS